MEINYNTVYIEDSDEGYGKHLTPETLIVSFGGDGTALKAMKTSWSNDLLFMPLGTGRVGYLVNQSGDIHDVLKSWINEDNEIVKRSAVIQNSEKDLPAFNEVVIIKNSPTRILDVVFKTHDQTVKLRADGIIISTSLFSS